MKEIRLNATAAADGRLVVEGLRPGERVELVILRSQEQEVPTYPLRKLGPIDHYDRPFDPVGLED